MVAGGQAGPYPRERLAGHLDGLRAALGPVTSGDQSLRSLAPGLSLAPLLEP